MLIGSLNGHSFIEQELRPNQHHPRISSIDAHRLMLKFQIFLASSQSRSAAAFEPSFTRLAELVLHVHGLFGAAVAYPSMVRLRSGKKPPCARIIIAVALRRRTTSQARPRHRGVTLPLSLRLRRSE
jgi:hypothetical protein